MKNYDIEEKSQAEAQKAHGAAVAKLLEERGLGDKAAEARATFNSMQTTDAHVGKHPAEEHKPHDLESQKVGRVDLGEISTEDAESGVDVKIVPDAVAAADAAAKEREEEAAAEEPKPRGKGKKNK